MMEGGGGGGDMKGRGEGGESLVLFEEEKQFVSPRRREDRGRGGTLSLTFSTELVKEVEEKNPLI